MSKLLLACIAVFATACLAAPDRPELYDPTGKWDMSAKWGAGNCSVSGTTPQPVVVVASGENFLASTGEPGEVTTGTVTRDDMSAALALTVQNGDVLGDGGSVDGTFTIAATANLEMSITGTGKVVLTGGKSCSQVFALSGTLL